MNTAVSLLQTSHVTNDNERSYSECGWIEFGVVLYTTATLPRYLVSGTEWQNHLNLAIYSS